MKMILWTKQRRVATALLVSCSCAEKTRPDQNFHV